MSRTGIKSVSAKKSSTKDSSENPKLKTGPSHPSYFEMIKDAITSLKERTGSSSQAISKFISEKEKSNLTPNYKRFLSLHLKRSVESGKLVKVKNSFKLSSSTPPSANPKNTVKTTTPAKQNQPTTGKRPRSSVAENKSKPTKSKSTKVVSKNKPTSAKKSKKQVAKKPKSLKVSSKSAKKA